MEEVSIVLVRTMVPVKVVVAPLSTRVWVVRRISTELVGRGSGISVLVDKAAEVVVEEAVMTLSDPVSTGFLERA